MNLHFTEDEKVLFLTKRGFNCCLELVSLGFPEYHNAIKYENVEVWVIYGRNNFMKKPSGYGSSDSRTQALDFVFHDELKKKILEG